MTLQELKDFINWKYVITIFIMGVVILGMIIFYIGVDKDIPVNNNQPNFIILDKDYVYNKLSKKFNLDNDTSIPFRSVHAVMNYYKKDRSIVIKLSESMTNPIIQYEKIESIQRLAAQDMELSIDEMCTYPFKLVDFRNNELPLSICYGEE